MTAAFTPGPPANSGHFANKPSPASTRESVLANGHRSVCIYRGSAGIEVCSSKITLTLPDGRSVMVPIEVRMTWGWTAWAERQPTARELADRMRMVNFMNRRSVLVTVTTQAADPANPYHLMAVPPALRLKTAEAIEALLTPPAPASAPDRPDAPAGPA